MTSIKEPKKTEEGKDIDLKEKSDLNMESVKEKKTAKKDGSLAYRYLIEPWITEKSHLQMSANKYIFKVAKNSDKKKVATAIEGLYGVEVVAVNIVNIPSKTRRYGKSVGKKSGYKKAIATLKEGDKIEIFEGA
jgi:large subunit ribosomal protein L23